MKISVAFPLQLMLLLGANVVAICAQSAAPAAAPPTAEALQLVRLFPEPLAPVGTVPSEAENSALSAALLEFESARDAAVLEAFVKANPASAWTASVRVNLGLMQFDAGYYGRALENWTQAWNAGKDAAEPEPIVLRGLAEALKMNCRVGRVDDAKALLAQLGDRKTSGLNATMIDESRKAIGQMETMPAECFKCGPFALSSILAHEKKHTAETVARLNTYATTPQGTSLSMVMALANEGFGMKMQAAKRLSKDAPILVPAVINWKLNHYGALLEEKDGRYLMADPTFGTSQWIGKEAIDEESSGYFVVSAGDLPEGWKAVDEAEAGTIWGRGDCAVGDGNGTGPNAPKKGKGGGCGMAGWSIHHSLASLNIEDIPLFYDPPVGPPVHLRVNYSQLEQNQPTTINFSNLGALWNLSWVSYLTFDSNNARLRSGDGGTELYTRFNSSTNTYDPDQSSYARLVKISPTQYERREGDGSKMVFDLPDGTGRLFMSQMVDAQGNALTFGYDANFRLITVTDAVGQVTTLTHGSNTPGDPTFYLVTAVTDPFSRSALLSYDAGNRLTAVMDQIGIISSFNYDSNGKVVSLTTPYGVTSFDVGTATVPVKGVMSWVEVTEPNGGKQRVESLQYSTTPASDAAVPAGMPLLNQYMNFRNSYYWDTKAMQVGAGDYTKANLTHFLHLNVSSIKANVIESEKDPLESRIWYFYHNQNTNGSIFTNEGMGAHPTHIGRVLDDASTQLERFNYNDQGNITQTIDPLGRTTNFTYAANGIDVNTGKQVNAQGGEDLLATFTWNSQHLPVTITDASGAVTSFSYNARGQLTSVTNALGQTATYAYDALGRLLSADGPLAGTGDRSTFTYDAVGRTNSVTNGEGYMLVFQHDNLDRVTRITYPDGSYEQITYTNLSPTQLRDRQGRITTMTYDSMQQLVSVTDPLSRVIKLDWCQCGSLRRMIDPMGRVTTWDEDVQGRTTSKTYGNGTKEVYQYEATNSRLARVTDAKGQSKVFSYNLDDSTAAIAYQGALQPTPGVSFAYDPAYPRLVSMTDGLGATTYSYGEVNGSSTGANLLRKVKTLWNGVEITFQQDLLGRVNSRAINGVSQTVTHDAAGRVTALTNVLGSFGFTYEASSSRITGNSLPNGQSVAATYSGNSGDRRLQQLRNLLPGAVTLSQHDYSYNAEGQITSWTQQSSGNPALAFNLSYDAARQLAGMSAASRSFAFTYDAAGNLKTKTRDAATTTFSHNILNELQTASPPLGNDKTYLWDAEDRLVGIQYTGSSLSTRIKYDGMGRCVEITELNGTTVTSTKRFVWCGFERCEERDASGAVTRRFFGQGEQINGVSYYYAFDHLGSVREMTDGSGAIRARYDYDPYGERTKLAGDLDASFGFTGHYFHAGSGLHLTLFRAYDAQTGRWLSRDPLGEEAGMNLYAYVGGSPVDRIDPFGLVDWSGAAFAGAGVIGNGFGMLGGAAFATATGVSGVGAVVGGAVAVKSAYGVGANLANLGAALMDREDGPYSNGSLFNDAAGLAAPGNDTAQALATAADLSLDLGAGRMAAGLKAAPFGPFVGAARGKTFVGDKSDDMLGALGGLSAAQAGAGVAGFMPPSPPKPGAKPKAGNGKAGAKPAAGKNKAKPKPKPTPGKQCSTGP
jgi:RHS repeat-associated protein